MKLISIIILLNFSYLLAEECNWTTIQEKNGEYIYSRICHKQVGKLVKDEKDQKKQIENLEKTIEYKDLMITKYEERIDLWITTSEKLENKVNTIERWKTTNQYLYFALGVVVTGLSVYLAGQVYR